MAIVDLAALVVILEFLLKRSIGVGAAETLVVALGGGALVTSCTKTGRTDGILSLNVLADMLAGICVNNAAIEGHVASGSTLRVGVLKNSHVESHEAWGEPLDVLALDVLALVFFNGPEMILGKLEKYER